MAGTTLISPMRANAPTPTPIAIRGRDSREIEICGTENSGLRIASDSRHAIQAVHRHDILITLEPGGTYVDWRKVPKFGIREVRPHNWTIGSPANDPFTHYRALTIKMDDCLPREGQTGHNFLRPFAYLKGQFPV